jgi:hypothetical protein
MKKFNIFEVYGNVHGEKIEAPKVEVTAYSPISTKKRTPQVVNGKFSLTESLRESVGGERTLATDVKRHFLEIISTYNSFREQMSRQSDIVETAHTLGGVVDAAKELTLREAGDWFDKVTIKRNMSELDKLDKQFDKFAIDAKQMDERLHALYEDMGHILNRYYEIHDIDPAIMHQQLGKAGGAKNVKYNEGVISEIKKLKPNTSSKSAGRVIAKIKKDWGANSDVYEELSDWMSYWYKFKDPDAPLSKPAIDTFNHIIDNYDLIEGVNENLLGMKKVMIDKSKTGSQRYEYVIKGKKAKVTIDVLESSPEEQGYKRSNMVSIRSSMGEWLADTPKNFKKISELEAFVKKVHPTLVKIANGEVKSNGVAFPE